MTKTAKDLCLHVVKQKPYRQKRREKRSRYHPEHKGTTLPCPHTPTMTLSGKLTAADYDRYRKQKGEARSLISFIVSEKPSRNRHSRLWMRRAKTANACAMPKKRASDKIHIIEEFSSQVRSCGRPMYRSSPNPARKKEATGTGWRSTPDDIMFKQRSCRNDCGQQWRLSM